mmetsp:Transcript_90026/g.275568  ORF Transcript_90026/g.275568 Transcript_90026/m.275568 type:complete len:222 (-) Transcript_90026:1963-2628(-)
MWIRQLGLQIQLELRVVFNLVGGDLQKDAPAASLDQCTRKHWLEHRVELFADGFDEELAPASHRENDFVEPPARRELRRDQVVTQALLDPPDTLLLRVDHERPPGTIREHACVLGGHAICGQSLVLPTGNICVAGQDPQRVNIRRNRNLPVLNVGTPPPDEVDAEAGGERRHVAHESRRQCTIPDELNFQVFQASNCPRPPYILVRQANDQTLGKCHLFDA